MLRSEITRINELRAVITDDPGDLEARRQLADTYMSYRYDDADSGQRVELALAEYRRILALQGSRPDVSDLDLLRTQSKINMARFDLGEISFDELIADLPDIAAACERHLGPHHPETLNTLRRLPSTTPGIHERIITGWEHVVADREERLGPDHPDTLRARYTLSVCCRDSGSRPDEAREQHSQFAAGWDRLVSELTRRLGPVHPETVEARQDRALLIGDDRLEQVREAERIAADGTRVLGPDHPRTLHLQAQLAFVYKLADDADRGAALAERIIDRLYQVEEPDWDAIEKLRFLLLHRVGGDETYRIEELWARYPIPADDDEELFPGDPDYPSDR